nr:RVP_2 domain-containing protein [Tanacetum cinerariifolium]
VITQGSAVARKQQSDGFQEQMTALQAELKATKGLIQVRRYAGGGEITSPIPRSMRLDVPKFFGNDLDLWIFSITQYFTLLSTPVDQGLRMVGFNHEGDAAEWFLWMTCNNLITTWDGFLESDDAMESGDISFLNLLVDHGSPWSLQLWGTLGSKRVHIFIDNESTHNFVQPGVVERMYLQITGTKPFKVYIGGGETLLCENMCAQVTVDIEGLRMDVDFLYVLPMKGSDIVLGIQRSQKLGKVTHEYSMQTMEFTWLD